MKRLIYKLKYLWYRLRYGEAVAQWCFFDNPDAPWNKEREGC